MRELVRDLISKLQTATASEIGEILFGLGRSSNLHSARVQGQKHLNVLVQLNELERIGDVYRVKGSQSFHKDHSRLINKHLIELLKLPCECSIRKEHWIEEVKLRVDAIVFLKHGDRACCAVQEICETESQPYIISKANTWAFWGDAKNYLSRLFRIRIQKFSFVVSGNFCPKNAVPYEEFMNEVRKEVLQ